MDTFIKALTAIKLLLQIAFYGILLGGTIYFLLNNPLPKLLAGIQEQALQGLVGGAKR